MAIILRSVKGSNLTASEVDGNFTDLDSRVETLEVSPPAGVGITSFEVSGSTFTVYLSDASVFGPFSLPVAAIRWAGNWVAGTSYDALDLFFVPGYGLYLVLVDYEAPTEFDPAVSDTDGPLLRNLMAASVPVPVLSYVDDHDLIGGDLGGYIRMNKATAVAVNIPLESVVPVEEGTVVSVRQVGAGKVTFVTLDSSIVVNTPETMSLRKAGSVGTLIKVGPDEWDLSGDLELA